MHNLVPPTNPLEDKVTLRLKSMYDKISVQEIKQETENNLLFPLVASIDVNDDDSSLSRKGLDLILVVDVSGSMRGTKIDLVKKTLSFVVEELTDKDTLSLVTFNASVSTLFTHNVMNKKNKEKISKIIQNKVNAGGLTNIKLAMERGFKVHLERRGKSRNSAMMFISDGNDMCGNKQADFKKCIETFQAMSLGEKSSFPIYSFGYGEDHDERVLNLIATKTQGSFYYIKTLKFIRECFIDSFGKLLNNIASSAKLKINLGPDVKLYSPLPPTWKIQKQTIFGSVPLLVIGKSQHFTFEVGLPLTKLKKKKNGTVSLASVSLKLVVDDENYLFDKALNLKVVEKNHERGDLNLHVAENFMKLKALVAMQETKKKLRKGEKGKGKKVLNSFIQKMKGDSRLDKGFKDDLENHLEMDNMENDKNFFQIQHILNNDVYNPDFSKKENKTSKGRRTKKTKKVKRR